VVWDGDKREDEVKVNEIYRYCVEKIWAQNTYKEIIQQNCLKYVQRLDLIF